LQRREHRQKEKRKLQWKGREAAEDVYRHRSEVQGEIVSSQLIYRRVDEVIIVIVVVVVVIIVVVVIRIETLDFVSRFAPDEEETGREERAEGENKERRTAREQHDGKDG
jgi:predicted metalloprotease